MSENTLFITAAILTATTMKMGLLVGFSFWLKKYNVFDDPFEEAFHWLQVRMEGSIAG